MFMASMPSLYRSVMLWNNGGEYLGEGDLEKGKIY